MEFPTYQSETDSVILLNLDDKTLVSWLLDDQYVRSIFKAKLNDFMKRYISYENQTSYKKVIDYDDQEKLLTFASALISQPQLVKEIIYYLSKNNIKNSLYMDMFYELIDKQIDFPIINVTIKDFKQFYAAANDNTNWIFLEDFVENTMTGWPLEAFIPLFEIMILAANGNEDILRTLRKIWKVYGDGYAEEALGYYDVTGDRARNEDYIMLVKYIYQSLGMEEEMLFAFGEEI